MKRVLIVMAFFYLAVAGLAIASEKDAAPAEENSDLVAKVAVQAAVLDFISDEACEVHGVCKLGSIRARYSRLLDEVEKKDGYYVAYAEFLAGKNVFKIEYYVKAEDGSYTVMKEVILTRNGEPVDEVMWEKGSEKKR